jgi:FtsH-binding integral membrane protein
MFGFSQPNIMAAVARHPFLSFLCAFAPLMLAQTMRNRFPANIGLTLLFTFVEGVWISPLLFVAERQTPGSSRRPASSPAARSRC